jgi:hypothetical protein
MAALDRITARALVEAGYMPLAHYIELFGDEVRREGEHTDSPSTAPETETNQRRNHIAPASYTKAHD